MRLLSTFLPLLFFCITHSAFGQPDVIEKLTRKLATAKDTLRIATLNDLAWQYLQTDTAMVRSYASTAIKESKEIGFPLGIAKAHTMLGIMYGNLGKFDQARYHMNQSLEIYRETNDQRGQAAILNNLGVLNHFQGRINEAVESYVKAVKAMEIVKDTAGICIAYLNISRIYSEQQLYDKSLEYSLKSEEVASKLKDPRHRLRSLSLTGQGYMRLNKDEEALKYFKEAYQLSDKMNDLEIQSLSLSGLSQISRKRGDLNQAEAYIREAIAIEKSGTNHGNYLQSLVQLAGIQLLKGNTEKAVESLDLAYKPAVESGMKDIEKEVLHTYAEAFAGKGDYRSAFQYHKAWVALKDSLMDREKLQMINNLTTAYETEKKEQEILLLNQQKVVADNMVLRQKAEIKEQSTRNWALGSGLILMVGLSLVSYRAYTQKRRSNEIITRQKDEVEKQKILVEEKHKEISDSIRYAERIQAAILNPEEDFAAGMAGHFVLFKPRDVVSGDFYWSYRKESKLLFAVADCTGHGVPGAMMSMIGHSFLNELVIEKGLTDPGLILDGLKQKVVRAMERKGVFKQRDGMDIALCTLDFDEETLSYAGANNPAWIVKKETGEAVVLKADKMPVGASEGPETAFSTKTIPLEKGDQIYLFSDGFADQFGGPSGKKFKSGKLRELIVSLAQLPLNEQLNRLDEAFINWQGELEQVDDVCMLGMKY